MPATRRVVAMTADWQRSGDRRVRVAEAPGGELLTVTMVSRTSQVPAVLDAGGRTRRRGTPSRTRLEAQRGGESPSDA